MHRGCRRGSCLIYLKISAIAEPRIVAATAASRHATHALRRGTAGVLVGFAMLETLYDNGPVLVINKPAGILTQAPAGIDSLEVQVKAFYRQREGKEGTIYLGLPHRLDRPV